MSTPISTPTASSSTMMYLKTENTIVFEQVKKLLNPENPEPTEPADIRITDFDDARFRIEVTEEGLIRVSLKLNNYDDLKTLGIDDYLRTIYGNLMIAPFEGADVTLAAQRGTVGDNWVDVALKIANLRKFVISWPVLYFMESILKGTVQNTQPFILRTNPYEPVYFLPRVDRVVVIFYLRFAESTDRAIARIISQELTEANKQVNNSPPCTWTEKDIPMELRPFPANQVPRPQTDDNSIGFITFSIFPGNFKSPTQREQIASQISLFKNFLTYHIKAAKSYLHARMRNRADLLQKVLNRAVPEDPFGEKEKKLASGKTFVRKV